MKEVEESARKLIDVLRRGNPDDVTRQEIVTMIFSEGFKVANAMAAQGRETKEAAA